MGEYEPDDSRTVTQSPHRAPGGPPRPGPREDEARTRAKDPRTKDESEPNETRGKPTARDAAGNKQPGYADKDEPAADEDSVSLGK